MYFAHDTPPCSQMTYPVRGSASRLMAAFSCPGTSSRFLAAVKVDGELLSLRPVECAGYGGDVTIDLGTWEPADSAEHLVEVILDPMDLFEETDESNNRVATQVRVQDPDVGLYPLQSGFVTQQGYWVTEVNSGVPVDLRTSVEVNGAYPQATVRMRSGTDLDATLTHSFLDCQTMWSEAQFVHRWTPPAPGDYDVEFSVAPPAGAIDRDPANNVVVKRLRVFPP